MLRVSADHTGDGHNSIRRDGGGQDRGQRDARTQETSRPGAPLPGQPFGRERILLDRKSVSTRHSLGHVLPGEELLEEQGPHPLLSQAQTESRSFRLSVP